MTTANPVQVSFHGVAPSKALQKEVAGHLEHLQHFSDQIHGCRVVIEPEEGHHRSGSRYHVRVRVHVPGKELVVGQHPSKAGHEDVYVAIHDAFKALERQLQDYMGKRRQQVKPHFDPSSQGRVASLVPEEDYGTLESFEGREIYFHRNSLVNTDFDELVVGSEVRFVEEEGHDGPQASTVVLKAAI